VTGVNIANGREVTSFLQVSSGIKIEYNPANGNNTKLVAVTIGGKPLDNSTTYEVVTLDFIAGGGDNFFTPTTEFVSLDTQDQVLTQYVQSQSPVNIKLDGRIAKVDRQRDDTSTPGNGTSTPDPAETGAAVRVGTGAGVSILAVVAGLLMW
jgi:2',3'-cyclic-nucleotide 2'-phosphodiesterase (5'-nucleotidase family)